MYVRRHWQYNFSISDDGIDDLSGAEAESPTARPCLALLPIKLRVAVNTTRRFYYFLKFSRECPVILTTDVLFTASEMSRHFSGSSASPIRGFMSRIFVPAT